MQPNWLFLSAAFLLSFDAAQGKAPKGKAPLQAPKSASVLDDEIAESKLTSLAVAMCPFAEEPVTFDLHLAQIEAATSKLSGMTIYRKSAPAPQGLAGALAARRSNVNGGRSSRQSATALPGTLIFAPSSDGALMKDSAASEAFSSPFGSISSADPDLADFGLMQPIVPGRLIFGPRASLNEQIPIAVSASYGRQMPADSASKLSLAQDPLQGAKASLQQADGRVIFSSDPFTLPSGKGAVPTGAAASQSASTSSNPMSLSLPLLAKISQLDEKLISELEFDSSTDSVSISLNSTIDVGFVKNTLIPYFLSGEVLDRKSALSLLFRANAVLMQEQSLHDIRLAASETLLIFGDVHGQFPDFIQIFGKEGYPSSKLKYLFNGDIVDRGAYSIESLLVLLALKIAEPKNVFITLGNHETTTVGRLQFYREAQAKFDGDEFFHLAHEVFRSLPVAFLVQDEIFVAHGGVTPHMSLADIRGIDRLNPDTKDEFLINNLIWSDPVENFGVAPSHRGLGFLFGPDVTADFLAHNNLSLIIRSHQYKEMGYSEQHDDQCITIFSCPNYRGKMNNLGAYIRLAADLSMSYNFFLEADHDEEQAAPEEKKRAAPIKKTRNAKKK